jgi:hypothetical protein
LGTQGELVERHTSRRPVDALEFAWHPSEVASEDVAH